MIKYVKSVVVLTLICGFLAIILAVTNSITAPVIAKNELAAANEALLVVYPDGKDFQEMDLSAY
ncbi:MAG: proton-conducting membrane transporter, partial [Clostridia bacterium]|nr:proton-conducting membrane transporter [Clostridia bacterium]